jgi:hypothetical protein
VPLYCRRRRWGGMELGLDGIEQCWDQIRFGKVSFEGQKAFCSLSFIPFPRRKRDLVAAAGEFAGDGGTNSGTSSENKYNWLGCRFPLIVNDVDESQGSWNAQKLICGIEE